MQKVGFKYGVICGLVYVVLGLVALLMGTGSQKNPMIAMFLGLIIVVATFFVIFYGVKEYRDTVNGGMLTIGEAVKLGGMIALIASFIAVAFNLLYNYVIDPGYMERMLSEARDTMEEKGMSDEQIDAAMKWTEMMQKPALSSAFSIVWYSLWGLVKGLISGAILKKEAGPTV